MAASHPEQSVSLRYVGETVLEITRKFTSCINYLPAVDLSMHVKWNFHFATDRLPSNDRHFSEVKGLMNLEFSKYESGESDTSRFI